MRCDIFGALRRRAQVSLFLLWGPDFSGFAPIRASGRRRYARVA